MWPCRARSEHGENCTDRVGQGPAQVQLLRAETKASLAAAMRVADGGITGITGGSMEEAQTQAARAVACCGRWLSFSAPKLTWP